MAARARRFLPRLVEPLAHRWPWSRGRRFARAVRVLPRPDLIQIGSEYGGWVVPDSLLSERSVCYCGGVGADITFDLGLIERYGCSVYAFDPTPRATANACSAAAEHERYSFLPYGLWGDDRTVTFFAPRHADNPAQVENWSARGQDGGLSISAECRSVASLQRELGHDRIDLLKLDVEGAEYKVLDAALRDGVEFGVLCVEFHKAPSIGPMIEMTRRLEGAGFEAVALSGFDVTFVRPGR